MYENIAYTVSAVGNKVSNIIKILLHLLSLILPIYDLGHEWKYQRW